MGGDIKAACLVSVFTFEYELRQPRIDEEFPPHPSARYNLIAEKAER